MTLQQGFSPGQPDVYLRYLQAESESRTEYKTSPLVATGGCVLALAQRIINGTPLKMIAITSPKSWKLSSAKHAN